MMKWYNIEFNVETREMIRRVEAFKEWLYDKDVTFETSAAGHFWIHFEIELSPEQVPAVNAALDRLVWFDSITEVA